ncbi:MAG: 16S rRNA (guanine(527)-N(7))-methyltransferase RsmG [Candidatus Paracaedibacteraceae bacterium]|nr:16S rRNA (guanine(527)-N(7))-methyltransferase RsmG [Candidatus Paracaedibacteraceae bacterium]
MSDICDYVSRETADKFAIYHDLLSSWNRNTALVQLETIDQFYRRHILDSLQLMPLLPQFTNAIDLGTGAGFPGMVLSIAGIANITLCDSNQRKIVFLNELSRLLDMKVETLCARIESIKKCDYDLVFSRAYADLSTLLKQVVHVSRETQNPVTGLFLKGKIIDREIELAYKQYDFNYEKIDSITSNDGVILRVYNIRKL